MPRLSIAPHESSHSIRYSPSSRIVTPISTSHTLNQPQARFLPGHQSQHEANKLATQGCRCGATLNAYLAPQQGSLLTAGCGAVRITMRRLGKTPEDGYVVVSIIIQLYSFFDCYTTSVRGTVIVVRALASASFFVADGTA